ncbi:MAG: arylamine N-acetyltransferase [Acidobacteriota bacterium]
MSSTTPAAILFERYLAVLGVRARHPSLDALAELTAAHLARVPFENASKLLGRHDPSRRGVPDLARYLDGIEQCRFGGTCYANNFHLHRLLVHLGYAATLCGADMSAPNVHIVNVVSLDGRRYLADVGYGAPLVEPLAMDAADAREIAWGPFRYVFRPRGCDGRAGLEMYCDGTRGGGYVVNPAARRIEEFAGVIAESFDPRATFMNALFVARFGEPRPAMVRNLTLIQASGSTWRATSIVSPDDLPRVVAREFGMPGDLVRRALDGVRLTHSL